MVPTSEIGIILMSKYRTQFFLVQGSRLTAGEVHEHYGVSVDDLLAMHEDDSQTFSAHGYEVQVSRLGESK